MKITKNLKIFLIEIFLGVFLITNVVPLGGTTYAGNDSIVFPLDEISKLNCRFDDFQKLSSNCKMKVLVLKSKDYSKYINKNGGYNDYTRLYTVLWGSSYKYGWDVGHGGHIGVDIATSKGTPVYAIADGEVKIAKSMLGLGNTISINHKIRGKFVSSNYGHLSKILVKKGQWVKAGEKIGEVGSTGNSTGNHLHFQIDLDTKFHPYYYGRKECPYSYYDITEKGVCFNELQKNTIDPIVFFETKGKVLDKVKIYTKKVSVNKFNKKSGFVNNNGRKSNRKRNKNSFDYSIFDRTVYDGYSYDDIKKVQGIFKDLKEYSGGITGDYKDIKDTIISYQISNNIIKTRNDMGAGRFGPKTRLQAKNDYENFLKNGGKVGSYDNEQKYVNNSVMDNSRIKVNKVDRKNILTREEIENREVEEFLKNNSINLKLENIGGNIQVGKTLKLNLFIKTKRGRLFKGNMPKGITFTVDRTKVNVFPEKLYYFTDGRRDIKLTGLKEGNTVLYVKIGSKVIKTFNLKVFNSGKVTYPRKGQIYGNNSVVIGDKKTGLILFRDKNNRKLINFPFGGTYKLKTNSGVKICIKRGTMNNIRRIYRYSCSEKDYKDYVDFSYNDTVGGLLVFDYKVLSKNAKIELINNYNKKLFSSKNILVKSPNGLKSDYVYKKEVLEMLEKGVVGGINKGYFLENRELTQSDANDWIINTLIKLKSDVVDIKLRKNINNNIAILKKENLSKFRPITRKDFLDKAYKYLIFNKTPVQISIEYRDLDNYENKKINTIFNKNSTWKDRFGENYYRPETNMTRGEGAYFLSKLLKNNSTIYLSKR